MAAVNHSNGAKSHVLTILLDSQAPDYCLQSVQPHVRRIAHLQC